MEKEREIAKGSKQKFVLGFDSNSLGGMTLADVDFKVKFFAKELRDSKVTGIYEVLKSQCTAGDDGTYYPVCDTTGLDTGRLFGILEVMYHDDDTNSDLVEKIPMVSNVKIVPDVEKKPPVKNGIVAVTAYSESALAAADPFMYNAGAKALVIHPNHQLGAEFKLWEFGQGYNVITAVGGYGWKTSNSVSEGDVYYCPANGKYWKCQVDQSGDNYWVEVQ